MVFGSKMPPRVRDREHRETFTDLYVYAGSPFPPSTGNTVTSQDHCEDIANDYGPDHPFLSTRFACSRAKGLNAELQTGIEKGSKISNFWPYVAYASHLSHKTLDTTNWANLASRTSPNRPDINPFSLFQDLIDIPKMLKSMSALAHIPKSKLNAKELANQHLMFEFGLLPLIEDYRKLLQTKSRVAKRIKRLRTLANTGAEHRTIRIDSDHVEQVTRSLSLYSGTVGNFVCDLKKTTSVDRWASARWKLLAPVPEFRDDPHLSQLAWLIANGITPEGIVSGVWDLIPWSFLIDWFTNVGDYVNGLNNTLPVSLVSGCQMTKTETLMTFSRLPSTSSSFSSGGGTCTLITKQREVLTSSPAISTSLSILDAKHVSILGSLFTQRLLR